MAANQLFPGCAKAFCLSEKTAAVCQTKQALLLCIEVIKSAITLSSTVQKFQTGISNENACLKLFAGK
ncbi:MAG: hypothetical protein Q4C79_02135 [Neisseria sp.]|uniref:hypothetical protein n=1 Tax=Neisseria sp. TaxID=192066 RepID=UPI0026DD99E0|nr:hypothetical protein [Neisseria sp.]MDO4247757.1 hypothetical protein [Neisseria sp.]